MPPIRLAITTGVVGLIALGLSGCIATGRTSPAPSAVVKVQCIDHSATLRTSHVHFRLDGSCSVVEIQGQDDVLTAGTIDQLQILGNNDRVTVNRLRGVTISGQSNRVDAANLLFFVLNGNKNVLVAESGPNFGLARGNKNHITASRKVDLTDQGQGNVVTVR
jgi:hypothetical protein